ncbi:Protein of unknown function (DUF2490) [Porphyrobacter sp. LM 6]|nr:Protein of unknown function (DUF2490) [Porphyrobacter sp. LM 6]
MTRMSMRFALLLAALVAAWQPSKARASDEDTQFWLVVNATGDIADGTRLTIDASQRWREEARGDEQQTFRFNIDQTVAKHLRIGGGAMVLDAGGDTEIRPHQQIIVTLGRFEARTRMEERFFDGADRVELRLRQRLQYTQPLGESWRATLGGEWFGTLQGRNNGQGASTDQWRALTGVAYKLNDKLEIGANYWLLAFPRGDRPARYTHLPQAVLTYRF